MEFRVTVKIGPPAELEMDPLRQEGAVSMLGAAIDEVTDSIDDDSWLNDWAMHSYDGGVPAVMAIAAPSSQDAADYARGVVRSALANAEPLIEWQIISCEGATADRKSRDVADATIRVSMNTDDAAGDVDWTAWIRDHADHLRAFDLDVFDDDETIARLAAGALIFSAGVMIDRLFEDLDRLVEQGGSVADGDFFWVLEDLPSRFAQRYDVRFARRFVVATVAVTSRLTQDSWTSPASVAEALALHLVVQNAQALLDEHDLVEDGLDQIYGGFYDVAFDDLDHEWLYAMSMDGFEDDENLKAQLRFGDMRVEAWFDQRDVAGSHVDPYSLEIKPDRSSN